MNSVTPHAHHASKKNAEKFAKKRSSSARYLDAKNRKQGASESGGGFSFVSYNEDAEYKAKRERYIHEFKEGWFHRHGGDSGATLTSVNNLTDAIPMGRATHDAGGASAPLDALNRTSTVPTNGHTKSANSMSGSRSLKMGMGSRSLLTQTNSIPPVARGSTAVRAESGSLAGPRMRAPQDL
jgi:hypothetical protein